MAKSLSVTIAKGMSRSVKEITRLIENFKASENAEEKARILAQINAAKVALNGLEEQWQDNLVALQQQKKPLPDEYGNSGYQRSEALEFDEKLTAVIAELTSQLNPVNELPIGEGTDVDAKEQEALMAKQVEAATTMQRVYRGYHSRKAPAVEQVVSVSDPAAKVDEEEQRVLLHSQAATQIQSLVRGHQVRNPRVEQAPVPAIPAVLVNAHFYQDKMNNADNPVMTALYKEAARLYNKSEKADPISSLLWGNRYSNKAKAVHEAIQAIENGQVGSEVETVVNHIADITSDLYKALNTHSSYVCQFSLLSNDLPTSEARAILNLKAAMPPATPGIEAAPGPM